MKILISWLNFLILYSELVLAAAEGSKEEADEGNANRIKRGSYLSSSPLLQLLTSSQGYGEGVGRASSGLGLLLGNSNSLIHHQDSPYHESAADIANKAAGQATSAAASQGEAAYRAAQAATQKVAAQVSAAAQKAQAAAALKYAQAGQLTQAAQISQALVFREASQAAKTGRTVQAAEAIQMLALAQVASLQHALSQAEAQVAIAQQVLGSAKAAYYEQSAMLKEAQATAQKIAHQQSLAVSDLSSAQAAAETARAAATKALYKAHPLTGGTPGRYSAHHR
ncbi:hypothetical protein HAZT_HAZT006496 [Hyalella azteca]|uniref:Uncharacterized protein LOC108669945 n=1 Tax=Hyalella azteca TaxID=294128 RepID=A0A6A0GUS7_HYAAZ|nr:uncharacterized protein LOC108669945 [Hyalella azteca]KAA0188985.1 hypothetical protein HAZT_HAZT006496 [Hyalella azteca]